jgi:phosphopantetheinyl transferase
MSNRGAVSYSPFTAILSTLSQRAPRAVEPLLPQHAEDIQFHYGDFGKPDIVDQQLQFNLSHSENLRLVAISLQPVGIDPEFVRPISIDMDP